MVREVNRCLLLLLLFQQDMYMYIQSWEVSNSKVQCKE